MKKLKGSARERATQDAKRRLKAEGFSVLEMPQGAALRAVGPSRRRYIYYPHMDRWYVAGGSGKQRRKLEALLAFERDLKRQAEGEAAFWSKLSPRVTIFSDAGYCTRTGCASWGAWIKADGARSISSGGEMEELCGSSTEAEMRGGANALALAIGRDIVQRGDVIMWQCDNIAALSWVLSRYELARDRPIRGGLEAKTPAPHRQPSKASQASEGLKRFLELCRAHELRVLVRHVRGHQEGSHRQWVNRLCDGIAARHLANRRAREQKPEMEKTA